MTATFHEVQKTPCRHANAFAWLAIIVTGPGPVSLGLATGP
jgi:hypothetical protein